MNANQSEAAIKAAMANELHAGHGTMEVVGEATADGTVSVRCICGAMLVAKVAVAPAETAPAQRRRISVNDDGEKKDGA